jgi:hypothetical protein
MVTSHLSDSQIVVYLVSHNIIRVCAEYVTQECPLVVGRIPDRFSLFL